MSPRALILLLLFFPIIFGCTITKRVHRPGYHIEWKKNYRQSDARKNQGQETALQANSNTTEPHPEEQLTAIEIAPQVEGRAMDVQESRSSPTSSDDTFTDALPSALSESVLETNSNDPPNSVSHASKRTPQVSKKTSMRPLFWRVSGDTWRILGIILIIFGASILVASLLSLVGAFSGNGNGIAVILLDLILSLFGYGGWIIVLIIVILIILLVYLLILFVEVALGGPIVGLIVGGASLLLGLFFFFLGRYKIDIENDN